MLRASLTVNCLEAAALDDEKLLRPAEVDNRNRVPRVLLTVVAAIFISCEFFV